MQKAYTSKEVIKLATETGMRFSVNDPHWVEEHWFIWFNPNTKRIENQEGEEEDISEDTLTWVEYQEVLIDSDNPYYYALERVEKRLEKFTGFKYSSVNLLFPEIEPFLNFDKHSFLSEEESDKVYKKDLKKIRKKLTPKLNKLLLGIAYDLAEYDIPMVLKQKKSWFLDSETEVGDIIDILIQEFKERGYLS